MPSQLEVQAVSVAYGDVTIVHDVSFALEPGSIGCLLGPSGCGKTTLLRALAGFEPVSAGAIRLHGETVSRPGLTVPPERRRIGMVFRTSRSFPISPSPATSASGCAAGRARPDAGG
jgi:iron(III) transport system ATP-binding protein